MGLAGELEREVEQRLWERFVVPNAPDAEMGLWQYVGKGSLPAFLRVAASREAISLLRRERRYVAASDEACAAKASEGDLATELVKATYREPFREALSEAFTALSPRQKTLLRLHHAEHVTGEALARMYNVHRATITRWLAEARSVLVDETRRRVMSRVALGASDFQSVMGVLFSRLDLSISRVLAPVDE